jgi:hypothetical protein
MKKSKQCGGCGGVPRQSGGCGESQDGGAYKSFPASAIGKRDQWIQEVRDAQAELVFEGNTGAAASWVAATKEASKKRKEQNPGYETIGERYKSNLIMSHKEGKDGQVSSTYSPYGKKNKRPLTLDAAKAVLLQYYRDRSAQFKNGPLSALRKDISQCKKDVVNKKTGKTSKRTLTPCTHSETKTVNGKKVTEWFPEECRDSWKYRAGNTPNRTGPGVYDMKGLDDMCHGENVKKSPLYGMTKMRKTPVSEKSRKLRSDAMKAKWASMTQAQKDAIVAKRKATLAKKSK